MAKISMKQRELKKQRAVSRATKKRQALKEDIRKSCANGEIPYELYEKLLKMKRIEGPAGTVRRCHVCGRPHGVYRKFGLCRIHLRELVMKGQVPGVRKASW